MNTTDRVSLDLPTVTTALVRAGYDREAAAEHLGVDVDDFVLWLSRHASPSLVRDGDRPLLAALEALDGNRDRAARELGITRRVVQRFLERAPDVALRLPGKGGRRTAEVIAREAEGGNAVRERLAVEAKQAEAERTTERWIRGLLSELSDRHHARVAKLLGNDTLEPEERRKRLMVMVEDKLFPRASDRRFLIAHRRHPEVLGMLEREAESLIRRGFRRLSGKALFELLRLRYAHRRVRPPLNNYDTARYARLLVAIRPEWAPLFEFRRLADAWSLRADAADVTPAGSSRRRSRAPARG